MENTILALSAHVNKWGAERSMCAAMDALNKQGYHVVMIITSHGDIEELLKEYKIDYFVFPLNSLIVNFQVCFIQRFKRSLFALWKCLRNTQHMIKELSRRGIRPNYIYSNTIIPFNGILLSKYYHAKHILHIREFVQEDFDFKYLIGEKLYLHILNSNVDKVICISNGIYNKFEKIFGSKTIKIYNGVSISNRRQQFRTIPLKVMSMVFVGRLSEEKGILEFVNILEQFIKRGNRSVHLDVWGTGVQEEQLKKLVSMKRMNQYIKFRGYGNDVDLTIYDLGIMSSKCEGFGRVTVEYMLSGLPVLGYNGGATPEIIDDGKTGFLYDDSSSCIDKLSTIYNLKFSGKLSRLGTNGKNRAKTLFNQELYLKNMVSVFDAFNIKH